MSEMGNKVGIGVSHLAALSLQDVVQGRSMQAEPSTLAKLKWS